MADIRQNTDVTGKLTVEGGGASTPLEVKGSNDSGVTSYTQFKLTDQASGNLLQLFNQGGTSEFTVSTLGTTIGGSYVLPHVAPGVGQVLTRATGAGAGVLSWEDENNDATSIGGYDISGTPNSGNILQFQGSSIGWTYVNQVVPSTPTIDAVTTAGNTTTNDVTFGSITIDEVSYDGADGTEGQVLTTDGNGTLTFEDAAIDLVSVDVHNDSGATIARGLPVYITGTHASGKPTIALADNNGSGTMPCIGLVQASISNNTDGTVVVSGMMRNIDTSSFIAGDALYIDTTAGSLTDTRPTATTSKVQKVGVVTRSHATTGEILVMGAGRVNDIPNDVEVNDLSDVDTTGIADGDGIRYDGTSFVAGKWGVGAEDQTIPANQSSASTTFREITLDTSTNPGNAEFTSVTTLDLVDTNGNRLERVQSTEVDVGAGATITSTQEKYGDLFLKASAGGAVPTLKFNAQYSPGGTYAGVGVPSAPSNSYTLGLPTSGSPSVGDVLELSSIGAANYYQLAWTTPSSGGSPIVHSVENTPAFEVQYTGTGFSEPNGIHINADGAGTGDVLPLIGWTGHDSADNDSMWAAFTAVVQDDTNGSEDSTLELGSFRAGTFERGLIVQGYEVTFNNTESGEFTLPTTAGSAGQSLTWPSSGTNLEWSSKQLIYEHVYMGATTTTAVYIPFGTWVESTSTGSAVNSVYYAPHDLTLKKMVIRYQSAPGSTDYVVKKMASDGSTLTTLETVTASPSATSLNEITFTSASSVSAGEGILILHDHTTIPNDVTATIAFEIDPST